MRVQVKIELAHPLLFKRKFWVEDSIEIVVRFKYDKLFGKCGWCGLVTHMGFSSLEVANAVDNPYTRGDGCYSGRDNHWKVVEEVK